MIAIKCKSDCSGCYACVNICPSNCISMESNSEGFWYPKINEQKCINCGKCEKICPVIHKNKVQNIPVAYAAYNKNEQIRLASSSGGIFTLLAEWIMDNGGIVFGARFDAGFNVVHDFCESKADLQKFRGSKYVQSKIDGVYKSAKEFLDSGRLILFTGTPCQIGGLKAYLEKEYENLFTQDLICHGVPSPKVWQKYIDYRNKCAKSTPQSISFRQKNKSWKRYSLSFLFNNNTEYCKSFNIDLMMRAFLKHICLRPSCHSCAYKTVHRQSDITLADFWGIQNIMPHMDDDKGTSLVIVNSDKGKKIFNEIIINTVYESVDFDVAINNNYTAVKSVSIHKNRDKFFKDLENKEFDKLMKEYCSEPIGTKIIKAIGKKTKNITAIYKTQGIRGVLNKIKQKLSRN